MAAVSPKLRSVQGGYAHWCPACNEVHLFYVAAAFATGPTWSYDLCHNHPSFSPSMNISHEAKDGVPAYRCHYWLTAGYLHYCNDCTHSLKGEVVELPNLPVGLQF